MAPFVRGGRRDAATSAGSPAHGAYNRVMKDTFSMVDMLLSIGASSFHVFMRILGPCFICLALTLISFCTYTYFGFILPGMADTVGLKGQVAFTTVGLFLLTNTLFNYACAICKDPGLPPEFAEAAANAEELGHPLPRQCSRCNRMKPPRAHHCSVCRRCVLKMDHHCPWINNCVGWGNYRNFCLFMLFLAMSCCFMLTVFAPFILDFSPLFRDRGSEDRLQLHAKFAAAATYRRVVGPWGRQCITMSFMIGVSIFIAICILGGFHTFLVLTNQTTIEFQMNMVRRRECQRVKNGELFRNVYDMGRSRNFQQVFGPHRFFGLRWLLPYIAEGPKGDGLDFPDTRA
mmetsp:Transcript_25383/g.59046  ORF Transcript_25383/g.59046 Transcript_25383/m.59046 type:complete len:345 (-) Transcript_25383:248-1282(-)